MMKNHSFIDYKRGGDGTIMLTSKRGRTWYVKNISKHVSANPGCRYICLFCMSITINNKNYDITAGQLCTAAPGLPYRYHVVCDACIYHVNLMFEAIYHPRTVFTGLSGMHYLDQASRDCVLRKWIAKYAAEHCDVVGMNLPGEIIRQIMQFIADVIVEWAGVTSADLVLTLD